MQAVAHSVLCKWHYYPEQNNCFGDGKSECAQDHPQLTENIQVHSLGLVVQ